MAVAEQLCPICGCAISGEAYEREGIVYCCEPCAERRACECGCCTIVEKKEEPEE
ncbi:MAG: metallothionein [Chloroflexi bacterium]|nr:metallothionein [Chloroflexota bacterium]